MPPSSASQLAAFCTQAAVCGVHVLTQPLISCAREPAPTFSQPATTQSASLVQAFLQGLLWQLAANSGTRACSYATASAQLLAGVALSGAASQTSAQRT